MASTSTKGSDPTISATIEAHAILLGISFLMVMPLGGLLFRIQRSPHTLWIHASVQGFGYTLALAGMGLGIYFSKKIHKFNTYHSYIGLVVISLMGLQPLTGYIHHLVYKKTKARSTPTWVHLIFGRLLLLLGIINGGLGLLLAWNSPGRSEGGMAAWAVLAGVACGAYFSIVLMKPSSTSESAKQSTRNETLERKGSEHSGENTTANTSDAEKQ